MSEDPEFNNLLKQLKEKAKQITKQNKIASKSHTLKKQIEEYEKLQDLLKQWDIIAEKMRKIRRFYRFK